MVVVFFMFNTKIYFIRVVVQRCNECVDLWMHVPNLLKFYCLLASQGKKMFWDPLLGTEDVGGATFLPLHLQSP